jgi:hypothetical protein
MAFPRERIVSDSADDSSDDSSYSRADDSSDIVDDMPGSRDECWIRFINEGAKDGARKLV